MFLFVFQTFAFTGAFNTFRPFFVQKSEKDLLLCLLPYLGSLPPHFFLGLLALDDVVEDLGLLLSVLLLA